jgi:hypothetical protein
MIISISRDHCHVVDADDCARLHVTANGLDDDEAGAALQQANLGRAGEAGHVWLAVDALRTLARVGASITDWDKRFNAMITFARSRGWLDASGDHVAAHIERSAP